MRIHGFRRGWRPTRAGFHAGELEVESGSAIALLGWRSDQPVTDLVTEGRLGSLCQAWLQAVALDCCTWPSPSPRRRSAVHNAARKRRKPCPPTPVYGFGGAPSARPWPCQSWATAACSARTAPPLVHRSSTHHDGGTFLSLTTRCACPAQTCLAARRSASQRRHRTSKSAVVTSAGHAIVPMNSPERETAHWGDFSAGVPLGCNG